MVVLTVDVIIRPDQSLGCVNHVLLMSEVVVIWFAMPSDLLSLYLFSSYATLEVVTHIAS